MREETVAVSSDDGRYQAAMTVTTPPMPTKFEDPSSEYWRDLLNGQIESTLNETLDRLCCTAASGARHARVKRFELTGECQSDVRAHGRATR
jgi:hypothetical protein